MAPENIRTMQELYEIKPGHFELETLAEVVRRNLSVQLSEETIRQIRHCREFLERKISQDDQLHYGINTGFGSLCDIRISDSDITQLQHNLVLSHASGTGDTVPEELVRLMLLLKIQSLSRGHSGVRLELVQRLVEMYNIGMYPVVFELGSLGASGDLAPLAHLSLPLIGEGEVWYEGRRQRSDVVLKTLGWEPLVFQAKEALALLNGTQFSSAYAFYCLQEALRLADWADVNAAISYDAFDCRYSPLDPHIHMVRPHVGQIEVAGRISALLNGSEIGEANKEHVQDPYAFRCVPQVHGASRDALAYIAHSVDIEVNSVTDNPNLFPEQDLIVSGGNFHAQPLALPLDHMALALSEFGSISERRIYQLISGQRDLPPFLTPDPGLHSGMMIPQYTAAAIVSQNKGLCTPASADSIVSCNGQEDHVSMAANAGTKALRVVKNLERILAIEFMVAAQALEFRKPLKTSAKLHALLEQYREIVPKLEEDRILADDIEKTRLFMQAVSMPI